MSDEEPETDPLGRQEGRPRVRRVLHQRSGPLPAAVPTHDPGYLIDIIYLRDVWMHRIWMHRIHTSRAMGAELALTPDHDGRIVADVVAEWARRHGQPFTLELTGPAGGTFTSAGGGHPAVLDAVEFCCLLAGRGEATGLFATIVPF